MTLRIGVIADDFTGATDIASFLVENGLSTVQLCGVCEDTPCPDAEAVVISHKSRSCPSNEAVEVSLASYRWLKKQGCDQIFFKYCSTFDSTAEGNIGPVTDALMKETGCDFTIFSPALPVNGRTVYKGHLFVGDDLLSDSGMKNHPVTPMKDSSLVRLVEMQSQGKCGVIDVFTLRKGTDAVKAKIAELKSKGCSYAAVDAIETSDLMLQGEAFKDMALVTGGSGLAAGLAQAVRDEGSDTEAAKRKGYPAGKKAVVLAGSCSVMTNKQVERYASVAAVRKVEVAELFKDNIDAYVASFAEFVKEHQNDTLAPLVYATSGPAELAEIQNTYGAAESAAAVERFFAALAAALRADGTERFIVAGGETSGTVTNSLKVTGFRIGPVIAPGVPWVRSVTDGVSLTLKSGNFGDEDFFRKAQENFPV